MRWDEKECLAQVGSTMLLSIAGNAGKASLVMHHVVDACAAIVAPKSEAGWGSTERGEIVIFFPMEKSRDGQHR
jgi:hypothetical protein